MRHELTAPGRLIYVVGPSGAGKDSVITAAREILYKNNNILFASRYVTRVQGNSDFDIPVSAIAFAHYRLSAIFALDWDAHGLSYGISAAIDMSLGGGKCVVVNGSRAYLPMALSKYPAMTVVQISVPPDIAQLRLATRGREDAAAISERIRRSPPLALPDAQLVTIDNSGPLQHAVHALIDVLLDNPTASVGDASLIVRHGTPAF